MNAESVEGTMVTHFNCAIRLFPLQANVLWRLNSRKGPFHHLLQRNVHTLRQLLSDASKTLS